MELGFEVFGLLVIGPELLLKRCPRDNLGLLARYPVQPLCQPSIEVQSQGRVCQSRKGALIQRHGVVLKAEEVFMAQPEGLTS